MIDMYKCPLCKMELDNIKKALCDKCMEERKNRSRKKNWEMVKNMPEKPGIYAFVYRKKGIVRASYIGKTKNLQKRARLHERGTTIECIFIVLDYMSDEEISEIEKYFIRTINPDLNVQHKPKPSNVDKYDVYNNLNNYILWNEIYEPEDGFLAVVK